MNQSSLIPLCDQSSKQLQADLVNTLRLGGWRHREELARSLGVSVRAIRDAASQSNGEIISGQLGLKLTVCATQDELEDALARAAHQISEMSHRIVQTRQVWEQRTQIK